MFSLTGTFLSGNFMLTACWFQTYDAAHEAD